MSRYFTVDEANAMIPELDRQIREALFAYEEYDASGQRMDAARELIQFSGGATVDREKLIAWNTKRNESGEKVKESIEKIQALGAQVKDLKMGLVDFPALYKGEEVCLCWRLGEEAIEWWHDPTEGFQGRKPIDAEFLGRPEAAN